MNYDVIVQTVTYRNEDNFYTVFRGKSEDGRIRVFIGNLPAVYVGAQIELEGEEVYNKEYGSQIKVAKAQVKQPSTTAGLVKYLSSGIAKGIGERTAEKIVAKLQADTIDTLLTDIDKASRATGIHKNKLLPLQEALGRDKGRTKVTNELLPLGISPLLCDKIYSVYGDRSLGIVTNSPYKMYSTVGGVGFKTCDAIALKLGLARDSKDRIEAAGHYVLGQVSSGGNSYIPLQRLAAKVSEVIGADSERLPELLSNSSLTKFSDGNVYLHHVYQSEVKVAEWFNERCKDIRACQLLDADIVAEKNIEKFNFQLTEQQKEAIISAVSNKVSVITGAPGSGKTTIIKCIVDTIKDCGATFKLMAPTGKAAQRLSQSADSPATTIHRAVGIDEMGRATHHEKNTLFANFFIIDESSMIDINLARLLLAAIPKGSQVVFVGDAEQLPPVGAGSFFKDIIQAGVPTIRLDKTHRQSDGSRIWSAAQDICRGYADIKQGDDLFLSTTVTHADILAVLKESHYNPKESIILTMGNNGLMGVNELNRVVQSVYNPQPDAMAGFRTGDPTIHRVNNYEMNVFNGETGEAIRATEDLVEVRMWHGEIVRYDKQSIKQLDKAYALTVHRSQGSEYKNVYLILSREHYTILNRRLLYTAMTRAREKLYILGDLGLLKVGASKDDAEVLSGLKSRIRI